MFDIYNIKPERQFDRQSIFLGEEKSQDMWLVQEQN